MAYSKEDISKVRDSADIVEIISQKVGLKKKGSRYSGLCPFHSEKTPSFSVNPQMGLYYCFGCQEKGDVFTFLEKTQNLSFVESLEQLSSKYNIEIVDDKKSSGDHKKSKIVYEILEHTATYYHNIFLTSDKAGKARSFIRSKGFGKTDVEVFQIGFSSDYDGLVNFLEKKKYTMAQLLESGAVSKKSKSTRYGNNADTFSNSLYDPMANRIVFPIKSVRGQSIGFGGRALPDDQKNLARGKYRNTHETKYYNKSRELYAMNLAKEHIVSNDKVVICEGYTDVMAFFGQRINYAVATCGTSVTINHMRSLKNFTKNIYLAYDADAAGKKAIEKWYEWEEEFDLNIKVIIFPDGMDPGDFVLSKYVKSGKQHLLDLVGGAKSITQHKIDDVFANSSFDSVESRTKIVKKIASILKPIKNKVTYELYVDQVSEKMGISKSLVLEQIRDAKVTPQRAPMEKNVENPTNMLSSQVLLLNILIADDFGLDAIVDETWFSDEHCLNVFNAVSSQGDFHSIQKVLAEPDQVLFNEIVQSDVEVSREFAYDVAARILKDKYSTIIDKFLHASSNQNDDWIIKKIQLRDSLNLSLDNRDWDEVFNIMCELEDS